jgi:CUE domain
MAETTQNNPETVPPPVVTSTAEPAVTGTELSADETHLQSIFPDLDVAIIHDCYVLCDRNVERTVEFLLGDVRKLLVLE